MFLSVEQLLQDIQADLDFILEQSKNPLSLSDVIGSSEAVELALISIQARVEISHSRIKRLMEVLAREQAQ